MMSRTNLALLLCGSVLLAGCAEEPPPRTVAEFLENPIVLEAAVVRCAANRSQTRYEAECVNARQAVSILEAKEERERAKAFEAQSERKREALRQTQAAAAEARRRAAEAERRRREAAYLAQFGELPPDASSSDTGASTGNAPVMVLPEPEDEVVTSSMQSDAVLPASDGGNAPVAGNDAPTDLNSIREELQRRNQEPAD